jgi:hypothetical protein
MSQCHDVYDTVAPVPRRRTVSVVGTQCHDVYPAFEPEDDGEPVPEPEAARQPEYV